MTILIKSQHRRNLSRPNQPPSHRRRADAAAAEGADVAGACGVPGDEALRPLRPLRRRRPMDRRRTGGESGKEALGVKLTESVEV